MSSAPPLTAETRSRPDITVSWGARSETPEACAQRLQACARRLGEIHPGFSNMIQGARGKRKQEPPPLRLAEASIADLAAMILRFGTKRGDLPPYPLGFRTFCLASPPGEASMHFHCGSAHGNSVGLELWPQSALWHDGSLLRLALQALIEPWEAETALIGCHMMGRGYQVPDRPEATTRDSWNEGWLYWQRDDRVRAPTYKPPTPASSSEPWLGGSLLTYDEWAPPRLTEGAPPFFE